MFHSSKIFKGFLITIFLFTIFFIVKKRRKTLSDLHKYHLDRSPFKETKHLSKKERLARGLPPNKFYEQIYELTINPYTGEPDYESKQRVQKELDDLKDSGDPFAVPGQSGATPWYELGPNDAAGRSRGIMGFALLTLIKESLPVELVVDYGKTIMLLIKLHHGQRSMVSPAI